jgi:hypothetical protein
MPFVSAFLTKNAACLARVGASAPWPFFEVNQDFYTIEAPYFERDARQ